MTQKRLPGRIARAIMHIACWGDRIITEDKLIAAQILAERGYLIITALQDGRYEIKPTERARMKGATAPQGWRRYPPLRSEQWA
jgi:hypothetical protein